MKRGNVILFGLGGAKPFRLHHDVHSFLELGIDLPSHSPFGLHVLLGDEVFFLAVRSVPAALVVENSPFEHLVLAPLLEFLPRQQSLVAQLLGATDVALDHLASGRKLPSGGWELMLGASLKHPVIVDSTSERHLARELCTRDRPSNAA